MRSRLVFVAAITAVVVTAVGGWSYARATRSEAERLPDYGQQQLERFRQTLRDPQSAEFRDLYASRSDSTVDVCGRVNARNAFGGYTGWQRFVSSGEFHWTDETDASARFDEMWKLCNFNRVADSILSR